MSNIIIFTYRIPLNGYLVTNRNSGSVKNVDSTREMKTTNKERIKKNKRKK